MNPNNTFSIYNDLANLSEEADKVITKAYTPCESWFTEFKKIVDSTWSLICTHTGEFETIQLPKFPEISTYVGVIPTVENSRASERNKSKARAKSKLRTQLTVHTSPAADNGKSSQIANSIQKVKKASENKWQASLRSAKKGTPAKIQVISAKQESNTINQVVKSVTVLSRKGVETSEKYEKRLSSDPKSSYEQKINFNLKTPLKESKPGKSNLKKMLEAENIDSSSKKKNKTMESITPIQKTKADKVIDLKTSIIKKPTLPWKDYKAAEHSFLLNSSAAKKPDISEDIRRKLSLRRQQKVEEQKKKREEKFKKTKTTRLKLEKERDERILKLHKDREERATKLTDSVKVLDSKNPKERKKTNADIINTMVSTPVMKSTTKADRAPQQLNTIFMGNMNSVVKENKNQGTVKRTHISTSKTELNSTYAVPDNQKVQDNKKSKKSNSKDKMAALNSKQPIENVKKPKVMTPPKINVTFNQQKPHSYEMTPPPPISSYDISDVKSDDDDEETASSKPIPEWATGIMLKNMIFQQHYRNDCDKIFGAEIDMPDLKLIFDCQKNKNKYAQRSSSAVWNTPDRPIQQ